MQLKSKVAIVTGASRGLGKATAKALIEKGSIVFGISRDFEALDKLKSELGENFYPVALDVANENDVQSWIAATFSETIVPNILINNAGAGFFGKIDEISSEKWQQMMGVNLNAVFYLTAGIVPFMKTKKSGSHIINIGSILGKTTGAEKSAYSASKYAIQGFSEALFKELRCYQIKVSCINPGSIETGFFENSGIKSHSKMLQPKEIAETIVHVLETPDNVLIDELTIRPLDTRIKRD